jgi:four helix bundle protein
MTTTPEDLRKRTKAFALRIIRLVSALPKDKTGDVIGRQMLRSGTSVGANYRSACRARSKADFASKIGIVEEEADETLYWLELLADSGTVKPSRLADLMREAEELVAIFAASSKTANPRR